MFRVLRFFLVLSVAASAATASAGDLAIEVFNEMNLARTQPQRYATLLASKMGSRAKQSDVAEAVRFLQKARALPPLSLSRGMSQGARLHVADLGPRGGRGHYGSGRSTPWSRMEKFGSRAGAAGENIYYGTADARGIVCSLIVDSGVPGRAHRKNIFSRSHNVAGVAHGSHAGYGAMCVMNFATDYAERGGQLAGS